MQSDKKRVALVTGANTGVGFQVAKALAEAGYTVYMGARSQEEGEVAASEIGNNAIAIHLNITDTDSINVAAKKNTGRGWVPELSG